MTEAIREMALKQLSLHELHLLHRATMEEDQGWLVPAFYGEVSDEYMAVRGGGVGLLDLSMRGRTLVTGSEAIQFLNGLITNDMKTLAERQWMPAVFPNVQGRLIASVRVARLFDEKSGNTPTPVFLIDTEAATHAAVLETISRFSMAGDFHVADISASTVLLSLQGQKSAETVARMFPNATELSGHGVQIVRWNDKEITILRATHSGEDGYDLVIDAEHGADLWTALAQQGAQPVGTKAQEILRIEAGIPKFGIDIDASMVVSETSLDEAVSFTKGCYIGQEIIARIKYRGHVAKKLTGIVLEHNGIENEARIFSEEDKEIGRLTSVAYSPQLEQMVALAVLKYQYLAAGTRLKVVSGVERLSGVVADLPFVKGSWYQA